MLRHTGDGKAACPLCAYRLGPHICGPNLLLSASWRPAQLFPAQLGLFVELGACAVEDEGEELRRPRSAHERLDRLAILIR
jgi:hypothetical protein